MVAAATYDGTGDGDLASGISRSALSRPSPDERGASAVEFALVVVPLLMILFGILTYGLMFLQIHTLTDAAADGARAAVPQATITGATAVACSTASSEVTWMSGTCQTPQVVDECSGGDTVASGQSCPGGETVTGQAIQVTMRAKPLIDLPFVPEPSVLSYTSTMTLTGINQSGLAQ